jgi:hypothetical protein
MVGSAEVTRQGHRDVVDILAVGVKRVMTAVAVALVIVVFGFIR